MAIISGCSQSLKLGFSDRDQKLCFKVAVFVCTEKVNPINLYLSLVVSQKISNNTRPWLEFIGSP